jgi:hypothetical protein
MPVDLLRLEAVSLNSNVCHHHPFECSVNVDEAHTLLSSGHYSSYTLYDCERYLAFYHLPENISHCQWQQTSICSSQPLVP